MNRSRTAKLKQRGRSRAACAMQTFVSQIASESEVWIANDPDHMIHFNGERFLGRYPDVMPNKPGLHYSIIVNPG